MSAASAVPASSSTDAEQLPSVDHTPRPDDDDENEDDLSGPGALPPIRKRAISVEYLSPAPYSRDRQSSLSGAVFNLTATILGGGILSLPFCFALCGLIGGTLFVSVVAAASYFSIYILISCSRRVRHGASYEEVVAAAFGLNAGRAVQATLFALVYLVIVAYLILMRDLLCPLLEVALGMSAPLGQGTRSLVVLVVLLLISPLCMQRQLSALNWLSSACIVPMGVLTFVVVLRGSQQALLAWNEPDRVRFQDGGLKLFPNGWREGVYALPILACAYMCHFNVLPLHRELIRPTRPRIKKLVARVTGLCSALYLLVGIAGYAFARSKTDGNILNNFATNDPLAVLARVALSFTIVCGFPFVVLPARSVMGKIILLLWTSQGGDSPYDPLSIAAKASRRNSMRQQSDGSSTVVAAGAAAGSSLAAAASDGSSDNHEEVDAELGGEDLSAPDAGSGVDMFATRDGMIDHDPLDPEVDSDSEREDDADSRGGFSRSASAYTFESLHGRSRSVSRRSRQMSDGAGLTYYGSGGPSMQRYQIEHVRTDSDVRGWAPRSRAQSTSVLASSQVPVLTEGSPLLGQQVTPASTGGITLPATASAPTYISFREQAMLGGGGGSGGGGGRISSGVAINRRSGSIINLASSASMANLALAGLDAEGALDLACVHAEAAAEDVFSQTALVCQTTVICLSALLLSFLFASVATLWNLVGSSATILLSYVVPAACYLRIRREKPLGLRMGAAWALLILGIISLIICSTESILSLSTESAPTASHGAAPAAKDTGVIAKAAATGSSA